MSDRILFDKSADIISELDLDWDRGFLVQSQDTAPIMDNVKQLRDMHGGKSKSGNMRLKAQVPMTLWMQWMDKYGKDFHRDQTLMRRLINDSTYDAFRVDRSSL